MRRESLTDDMKADGAALLELSAALGMLPVAAAWLYGCDLGEWRYYLITPLVDDLGRKTLYEGLDLALPTTPMAERISIVDIYLAGPRDPVGRLVASLGAGVAPSGAPECCCTGERLRAYLYSAPVHPTDEGSQDREQAFWQSVRRLVRPPEECA